MFDEAKAELADLATFLREPARFTWLGGRVPKGYLLSGPPGTGKMLLARAVAGEAGVPFIHASGVEFEEVQGRPRARAGTCARVRACVHLCARARVCVRVFSCVCGCACVCEFRGWGGDGWGEGSDSWRWQWRVAVGKRRGKEHGGEVGGTG